MLDSPELQASPQDDGGHHDGVQRSCHLDEAAWQAEPKAMQHLIQADDGDGKGGAGHLGYKPSGMTGARVGVVPTGPSRPGPAWDDHPCQEEQQEEGAEEAGIRHRSAPLRRPASLGPLVRAAAEATPDRQNRPDLHC